MRNTYIHSPVQYYRLCSLQCWCPFYYYYCLFFCLICFCFFYFGDTNNNQFTGLPTSTSTVYSHVWREGQILTQQAHFLGAFTSSWAHCPNHLLTSSHPSHELVFGVQVCADPGSEHENWSHERLFCLIMTSSISKQWFWVGVNHHLVLSAGNYHLYWKHTGGEKHHADC